ncbi:hypothetical protein [Mesonia aestuariivivens]|uniref:Uncharacterized protein n=1 Tax=Mesonia aestuariivivens TaxID=2796128 RepID=A0ABS6W346_9FLAO|nr:hypothetical protein [Mesonia aestuariivivens]MBW2962281.1 hypothetical protein [Mesonia aestuariivivens]
MKDYQLIEFLLRCDFLEDELRVTADKICVETLVAPSNIEFLKEMEKTGRKFSLIANEIQFERHQINRPKLKIAQ